jgi:hypothetical protein
MSDISAKRAEEVAYNLQLSGISGSTWSATEVEASNMLRALAAENEKLRAALDKAADALHDAGCYEAWAAARAALKAADEIENLREAIEMARQCIDADDVIGAHQILTKALGEKG